jgi:hypothetical protein
VPVIGFVGDNLSGLQNGNNQGHVRLNLQSEVAPRSSELDLSDEVRDAHIARLYGLRFAQGFQRGSAQDRKEKKGLNLQIWFL